MRLLTAHRILIACSIAFAVFFALREWGAYSQGGDPGSALASALGLAVAIALAAYYRSLSGKSSP